MSIDLTLSYHDNAWLCSFPYLSSQGGPKEDFGRHKPGYTQRSTSIGTYRSPQKSKPFEITIMYPTPLQRSPRVTTEWWKHTYPRFEVKLDVPQHLQIKYLKRNSYFDDPDDRFSLMPRSTWKSPWWIAYKLMTGTQQLNIDKTRIRRTPYSASSICKHTSLRQVL